MSQLVERLSPGGVWVVPSRATVSEMLRLALPIVAVQVGLMAMGVADTLMVGHVSAEALAAVAIGNLHFFLFGILGIGVLMVLDPVIAQAVGAGDEPGIARGVQRGLVLGAVVSLLCIGWLLAAGPLLRLARQPAEVVSLAAEYAVRLIPGIAPFFLFVVLRQALQSLGVLRPLLVAILVANLANVALNWVMIFGHAGFPAMGVNGSAWATSASRCLMLLLAFVWAWPALRSHVVPFRSESLSPGPLVRMIRLGLPIGVQSGLEYGAFALVALLMGWLGVAQVAGHQVAINLASITFMVPMGVGAAAAVLVGRAVGRGDAVGARGASAAAILSGVGFMSCTALVFLSLPGPLARLYTAEVAVLAIAGQLIPLAGVFQVFDGIQVVSSGVLRGLGDTKVPMLINLLGYWFLGLPLSAYLGFGRQLGPVGLWWGLVVGLAIVAAVLLVRVGYGLAGRRVRVDLDAEPA